MAIALLRREGYRILERNYRCPFGEVDIVASDGDTLVFIEVKTRRGTGYGYPSEAVTLAKRQRLRKIARYFLQHHGVGERVPVRFDVVALVLSHGKSEAELIKDAFSEGPP